MTASFLALCGVLLALSPQAATPPTATFFVRLAPGIEDEKVTSTAHALVRTYGGRIRLINLRGFQVEIAAEAARAIAWDERVEMVARYPRVLEEAPAGKFVGSASHGERDYRIRLADSGRRYDQDRVAQIALELAAQYQGKVVGAFAPSIGRPWVVLKAKPPWARAMAADRRVAWVAERGAPAFAVSPEVSLDPLPRGAKKPPVRETKTPEPARGTLQRATRHFKDWYFVVLDPSRADVSSANAIAALADEISAATGAERLGGEFLKPHQGFRVSGTEEAALRIARDPRVRWVEEIGPFLRTTDPRPGEYMVALRSAGAPSQGPGMRAIAEDLADVYGGRIAHVWLFGGFPLADMAEESARALGEDPRVEFVEESCCVGPAFEVPGSPVIDTPSGGPGVAVDVRPSPAKVRRARHHHEDLYFVVLDETHVDVSSGEAIRTVGDDISEAAGAQRLAGEFVLPPQGFQVAATKQSALRLLRDGRVKWVEEIGDYIRATEPIRGSYIIEFDPAILAGKRPTQEDVRSQADEIVTAYGGRVGFTRESVLNGFTAEEMSDISARALSRDPRVKAVYENGIIRLQPGVVVIDSRRVRDRLPVGRGHGDQRRWGLEVLDAILDCADCP